ncbi:MAG: tetraacyldisaccharide 4'-kinase [Pseudomonadales bacterium]
MKTLSNFIERLWYGNAARYWPFIALLLPLSTLFLLVSQFRKKNLLSKKVVLPVPVVVVGNISVGGTGKTPLLCALADALTKRGVLVGIISRGYGGSHSGVPRCVLREDDPREVGDEPLLLKRATDCPVVIGRDRLAAATFLLQQHSVDVILSDDGMQHYALPRDVEIAVLDGQRGVGNGLLLPAGPLRESLSRLRSVDFVVSNGEAAHNKIPTDIAVVALKLLPQCWVSLKTGATLPLHALDKSQPVHAVAGIGNPQRFFSTVRALDFALTEHAFPDHHVFVAEDLSFDDEAFVVMTEKDAVKCASFAKENWYALRVAMTLPEAWVDAVWQAAQNKQKKVA